MVLKLYMNEISPSTRGILLTAKALNIWMKTIRIDDTKSQLNGPILEDRSFQIWNSHAIIAYLVGKYGQNNDLYPKNKEKREIIDERLRYDTEVLPFFINTILNPILDGTKNNTTKADREFLENVYRTVERFFENDSKWIAGNSLTVADLALIPSITSLDLILSIDTIKFPKLTNWITRCERLPCYGPNRDGLEKLKKALCCCTVKIS